MGKNEDSAGPTRSLEEKSRPPGEKKTKSDEKRKASENQVALLIQGQLPQGSPAQLAALKLPSGIHMD